MTYKPVIGAIDEIRPLCVGKDPRQVERLWETLFTTLFLPMMAHCFRPWRV
jgi:hypothetical protein